MQQLVNSKQEIITSAAEVGLPPFFPEVGRSRYHEGEGELHHDHTHFYKKGVSFS